ncbi:MAG: DMT family transporter [Candidatus Krumholzibacteriota bacterium]|nr:DMT family transporter [Candidatus Krumholzibacteriota bacterium]
MKSNRLKTYPALMLGIVSISFAAIFIKLAGAPAPLVAALRMIFSSLILLPGIFFFPSFRRELAALNPRELRLLLFSGVLLALHFLSWITSLSFTGITSSIVFVTASPLFVAIYTISIFREKVSRSFWVGMALAVVGGIIMGGNNMLVSGNSGKGDLLAIAGAVAAAGYFLVGSRLRKKLSLITYIFPVYTTAALILALTVPLSGNSFSGLSTGSYLYCFLMALVCQVSGHSLFNWALKNMKATSVTTLILGEPAGTTILAFLILGQAPLRAEIIGGGFILAGIFVVIYFNPGFLYSPADPDNPLQGDH